MSRVSPGSPAENTASYCSLCGGPTEKHTYDGGRQPPSDAHRECEARLQLEPPRFCAGCARRLKVQVTPLGWTSTCSRHGTTTSAADKP